MAMLTVVQAPAKFDAIFPLQNSCAKIRVLTAVSDVSTARRVCKTRLFFGPDRSLGSGEKFEAGVKPDVRVVGDYGDVLFLRFRNRDQDEPEVQQSANVFDAEETIINSQLEFATAVESLKILNVCPVKIKAVKPTKKVR